MTKILFFDGHCNLCNNLVDRLIRMDGAGVIKFASLQGETARKLLPPDKITELDPDTVLYLRDGEIFDRSTAVLLCLKDLGWPWAFFSVFLVVPKFLRDLVYRFVVRIRYQVFGRRDSCRLPTAEEKERLLP